MAKKNTRPSRRQAAKLVRILRKIKRLSEPKPLVEKTVIHYVGEFPPTSEHLVEVEMVNGDTYVFDRDGTAYFEPAQGNHRRAIKGGWDAGKRELAGKIIAEHEKIECALNRSYP